MKRFIFLCLLSAMLASVAAEPPAGYRVETIAIPPEITLGVGGLAFTPDGNLLICTREGEVWRYREGKWTLFADGLHEALGIFVDGKTGAVFVMQRPELTQLIDEDGDGRADLYRTINAGWGLTDNYHEYAYGPVRDAAGNFYGTLNLSLSWPGWAGSSRWDVSRVHDSKMGRAAPFRGWSFQVTADGKFVPWSSGLRSPNGIVISREGDLFYTDNQGDWNATSSLQHIVKGRFHGHPSSLTDHPDFAGRDLNAIKVEEYAALRTPPAVNFPHAQLASSPGQPVFDYTGGKFGPFEGQIFVGDQTRSNLMRVFLEKVGGEYQGAVFDFIDPLQTGVNRLAFASDGSLWVGQTGRGWTSVGGKEFGLQRVVWDGKTVPFEMQSVRLTATGFRIAFTRPLQRGPEVLAPATYQIKRWHYQYRPEYGSPKQDEKSVEVAAVQLSDDGRLLDLTLPIEAGGVYQITVGVKDEAGSKMTNATAWYTVNRLVPAASE
jgi:sugar lactone lactonase YvrE